MNLLLFGKHIVLNGVPDPQRDAGDLEVEPSAKTCHCLLMIYQGLH